MNKNYKYQDNFFNIIQKNTRKKRNFIHQNEPIENGVDETKKMEFLR